MSVFTNTSIKLINEYKSIIAKIMPSEERTSRLMNYEIKRKHLNTSTDNDLYHKLKHIISDIENWHSENGTDSFEFSGLEAFIQYLKDHFHQFQIYEDKVVHGTQHASRALLDAVQLIATPNAKLDSAVAGKINECANAIATLGSKEQHHRFIQTLQTGLDHNPMFFMPILQNFKRLIDEKSKSKSTNFSGMAVA